MKVKVSNTQPQRGERRAVVNSYSFYFCLESHTLFILETFSLENCTNLHSSHLVPMAGCHVLIWHMKSYIKYMIVQGRRQRRGTQGLKVDHSPFHNPLTTVNWSHVSDGIFGLGTKEVKAVFL